MGVEGGEVVSGAGIRVGEEGEWGGSGSGASVVDWHIGSGVGDCFFRRSWSVKLMMMSGVFNYLDGSDEEEEEFSLLVLVG